MKWKSLEFFRKDIQKSFDDVKSAWNRSQLKQKPHEIEIKRRKFQMKWKSLESCWKCRQKSIEVAKATVLICNSDRIRMLKNSKNSRTYANQLSRPTGATTTTTGKYPKTTPCLVIHFHVLVQYSWSHWPIARLFWYISLSDVINCFASLFFCVNCSPFHSLSRFRSHRHTERHFRPDVSQQQQQQKVSRMNTWYA